MGTAAHSCQAGIGEVVCQKPHERVQEWQQCARCSVDGRPYSCNTCKRSSLTQRCHNSPHESMPQRPLASSMLHSEGSEKGAERNRTRKRRVPGGRCGWMLTVCCKDGLRGPHQSLGFLRIHAFLSLLCTQLHAAVHDPESDTRTSTNSMARDFNVGVHSCGIITELHGAAMQG